MKKYLKASYKIRFLSGVIDIFIFIFITFLITFLVFFKFDFQNDKVDPIFNIFYYLWFLFEISIILFLHLIIPLFFSKGKTIGKIITKLQVVNLNGNTKKINLKNIIKKEIFYSLNWIFIILLFLIFINPEEFKSFSKNKELLTKKIENIENLSLKIKVVLRLIFIISNFFVFSNYVITLTIFKKNRLSIIDIFSQTQTVYKNKFEFKNEISESLKPKELNWESIEIMN
ncbi:RDD family protein [[Mycoplasma] collis]|uniref:RDD family protein n=1 Tax=[Mycoplasma] collis TaxID=2127 RepID=UPI00051C5B60|nr:RDD family protein [[Mycoplasma] collis]